MQSTPTLVPNLNAGERLPGRMTACSWDSGWRSLLLRSYDDPPAVEEFTTAPTSDHLIVLVTSGSVRIERRKGRNWARAHYTPGDIGMTAPGQSDALRWRGTSSHSTLQLHLPTQMLQDVYGDLTGRDDGQFSMPNFLSKADPMVDQVMRNLGLAAAHGVPDLYAETAGHLLAAHLLVNYSAVRAPRSMDRNDMRIRRVDAFMRENITSALSLTVLADRAGLSRFHMLRLFASAYGETPYRRLTRLRIQEAQRRLQRDKSSVTEIALACGYDNPSGFAVAFRRIVGVSPTEYRRRNR